MAVIGISCYFHDSSAALVTEQGKILAAVQEERFTRKKFDNRFPFFAVDYCLKIARETGEEITAYVYYEKPIRIFMRLLETYFSTAPRGITSFLPAMKTWIKDKIFIKDKLISEISKLDKQFKPNNLYFSEHHLSHAAAAFYPSPFNRSAILCLDAVGEWATSSAWIGRDNDIKLLWQINFPHSLGMLYSAFTYYCGFKVNSGEYKLMGLAPYGEPIYMNKILDELIDINKDGSFRLNMSYFKYHRGLRMISNKFKNLFGRNERDPSEKIDKFYADIAASIQLVLEEVVIRLVDNLIRESGEENLCLAGGVALNCVANEKIAEKIGEGKLWIQPAAGDAGSSLGCALGYLYKKNNIARIVDQDDSMLSAYLGPKYTSDQIKSYLNSIGVPFKKHTLDNLCDETANYIAKGKIVGWFQNRMEFGPRALGNRSILGDPRIKDMQKKMNLKIKKRESFRPFAPAVLDDYKREYFNLQYDSPYMLITKKLSDNYLIEKIPRSNQASLLDQISEVRSLLPGITHVDNSCRVQTVKKVRNEVFYKLIRSFYEITGCPVLINTSFNIRGEPIVCTPEDAFRCFLFTDIDVLVLGKYIVDKSELPLGIEKYFSMPLVIED